jgi:hypothetical protein
MDLREEREKRKALNLLNCTIEVELNSTKLRGEVYFFNEKALILKKEKEYIFLNICKYEDMKLKILEKSDKNQLKEELANEVVRPSEILAIILD